MKILHYYWTQINDKFHRGGGVQTYLRNIISNQQKNNEVYLLNSGVEYDFFNNEIYIKKIGDHLGCKQYSIVNSPILAPSKANFFNIQEYLQNDNLKKVFKSFIDEFGPFDIIHFHSLEGISLSVLELKENYPNIKFIYTFHNYYPLCPQVNFWKKDSENCQTFNSGRDCLNCIGKIPTISQTKIYYSALNFLERFGFSGSAVTLSKRARTAIRVLKSRSDVYHNKVRFNKIKPEINEAIQYVMFREKNIEYLNKYFSRIICVSERVKDICLRFGLKKDLLITLYIGTAFSENQFNSPHIDISKNPFEIAYMGYMRRDKGFYFFLKCLKLLDDEISKQLSIVVAAKNEDNAATNELLSLRGKFKNIKYFNGYTSHDISTILKDTNLGIVPVMWEDNLPQVAMEFKALGVPVLTSDLGGASELSSSVEFCFEHGNEYSFISKLSEIVRDRELLNKYYIKAPELQTVDRHCQILSLIYK